MVQPSRSTYLVIQALARVIQNQLKKDRIISAITEEDSMEILQRCVTSLEKRHKETAGMVYARARIANAVMIPPRITMAIAKYRKEFTVRDSMKMLSRYMSP